MSNGPYLFDVGVTALAHSPAPASVRDPALSYVREAIAGEIDAVVPYSSVVGAHNALTTYYGLPSDHAARLLENFMDAKRIHWYDGMAEDLVRDGLALAGGCNSDGWEGYYAQIAIEEGVETILTLDSDFERVAGVETDVILSPDEIASLTDFLGY